MMDQKNSQKTTLSQKAGSIAGLAMFPALSLMVFTRHKIGYRFLSPTRLMIMAILLWIYAGLTTLVPVPMQSVVNARGYPVTMPLSSPTANLSPMIIFALVMLALGLLQRRIRWQNIKNGVSWHTQSRGISWLSFLPLADTIIKRFVEPAACAMIGFLVSLLPFHFLGYYIIFAAICMFIFEAWDFEMSLNIMLDTLDDLVESEIVSGNVEYYSRPGIEQRPLEETAGIPTGIAPDIQVQIERRRSRRAAPADNLVTATLQPPRNQSGIY